MHHHSPSFPKNLFLLLFLSLILSGCGEPTIDAHSEKSFKASTVAIRNSLSNEDQIKFDEAMEVIVFNSIELNTILPLTDTGLAYSKSEKLMNIFDGMSVQDVIKEAGNILRQHKILVKSRALAEIRQLERKRDNALKARKELDKFPVVESRFIKKHYKYTGRRPVIKLSVVNWTEHSISKIDFTATLTSGNRRSPWLVSNFEYQIPGGIQPGSDGDWSLALNIFGDWGEIEAPADSTLTVKINRLDGSDGTPLYSTAVFSDSDAARLRKLKKEYSQ